MMTRKTKKHLAAVGNSSIHVGFGMRAAAAAAAHCHDAATASFVYTAAAALLFLG